MPIRTVSVAAFALAALSSCSNPSTRPDVGMSRADPASSASSASAPTRALSEEEMLARRIELATPGAAHAEILARAGRWDVDFRYRAGPDAPWVALRGSITAKPVLGGRFLLEEHTMEAGDAPMQGILLYGFDNASQEYTSLWMDTGSTWWVDARGRKAADGTTTMHGTMKDAGGERPYRVVVRATSADVYETELYDRVAGREELVMAYTSKRAR